MRCQRVVFWCLVLVLACAGWVGAEEIGVRVRWVVDGDTLIVHSGESIRLMGINAPELGRDDQPGQYYALQARECLQDLVQGEPLFFDPQSSATDRFQRRVSRLRRADRSSINRMLVEKGAAFVSCRAGQGEEDFHQGLLRAQQRAMQERQGFWQHILNMPAAFAPYVGNRRSKRFHTQECVFGQAIHAGNRRQFSSMQQAFQAGYAPGRCCSPWPARADKNLKER